MSVVYFPKEGDKSVKSSSYLIEELGLVFKNSIQKLDVLVTAGFLRKLNLDINIENNESLVNSGKTYEQWTSKEENDSSDNVGNDESDKNKSDEQKDVVNQENLKDEGESSSIESFLKNDENKGENSKPDETIVSVKKTRKRKNKEENKA